MKENQNSSELLQRLLNGAADEESLGRLAELAQDRRQLRGVEQSPEAQLRVEHDTLRRAVDRQTGRLLQALNVDGTALGTPAIVYFDGHPQRVGGRVLSEFDRQTRIAGDCAGAGALDPVSYTHLTLPTSDLV